MLHFKTLLLWLAFVLLIVQQFINFQPNIALGFIFRLMPSAFLLFWFLLSIFFKVRLKINPENSPFWVIKSINIIRPLSSLSIVLGAILKIMHWPFGNELLISGIGCMAIFSTLLSIYARQRPELNPNILDDLGD